MTNVNKYELRYIPMGIILWVLMLLDCIYTYKGLALGGQEGTRIIAYFMDKIGIEKTLVIYFIISTLAVMLFVFGLKQLNKAPEESFHMFTPILNKSKIIWMLEIYFLFLIIIRFYAVATWIGAISVLGGM